MMINTCFVIDELHLPISHLVVSSVHFKHRDVAASVDLLSWRLSPLTVSLHRHKHSWGSRGLVTRAAQRTNQCVRHNSPGDVWRSSHTSCISGSTRRSTAWAAFHNPRGKVRSTRRLSQSYRSGSYPRIWLWWSFTGEQQQQDFKCLCSCSGKILKINLMVFCRAVMKSLRIPANKFCRESRPRLKPNSNDKAWTVKLRHPVDGLRLTRTSSTVYTACGQTFLLVGLNGS